MDSTKTCSVKWSTLDETNFKAQLSMSHNGFAILTGKRYIVIDYDTKHSPPQEIHDILSSNCSAIEATPGGYHFWFLNDTRTAHFSSVTDAYWKNQRTKGIDIRANGGICYTAPSRYRGPDGSLKTYKWVKGNLGTATEIPPELLANIHYTASEVEDDTFTFTLTQDVAVESSEITTILNSLSQERVDSYDGWIRVGMALKNSGYDVALWDEWSKRSAKYRAGACREKWNSFGERVGGLTIASLFYWLKQDNYDVFVKLQGTKESIQVKIMAATNASIAEAFYEMNPLRYIFSRADGWFVLQPNNTWIGTGSKDILSIPNILNTIRKECYDVVASMLSGMNRAGDETESTKYRALGDAVKRLSSASFLKATTEFLPGLYHVEGVEKKFNAQRELFAFENCVLDMKRGEFRGIVPDDYISVTCGYDYRVALAEEKEVVRKFLAKIFPNDGVLEYVLRALSTCFEGYNRGEFFHVFTGLGANGKSCLVDLCKIVFGNYFRTLSVTYLTKEDDRKKDKPLPELAGAQFVRMLVSSEPEENDKFQVGMLKLLTGNDEVTFRGMYSQVVNTYVPQFKLWVLANELPRLSKYDQGIERRMRCVHFPTRFVACPNPKRENEALRDEGLKEKIKGDAGWKYGFLGLLLDAARGLGGAPLVMPDEVREFTEKYMLDNNPVGAWLRSHYDITGSKADFIPKCELFEEYMNSDNPRKTQKEFTSSIIKCNVGEKTLHGKHYFYGIVKKNTNEIVG